MRQRAKALIFFLFAFSSGSYAILQWLEPATRGRAGTEYLPPAVRIGGAAAFALLLLAAAIKFWIGGSTRRRKLPLPE